MAAGLIISLETIRNTHSAECIQSSADCRKQMGQFCVTISWINMKNLLWPCFYLKSSSCIMQKEMILPFSNVYNQCLWAGSNCVTRVGNQRWRRSLSSSAGLISAQTGAKRQHCRYKSPPPHKLPIFQSHAFFLSASSPLQLLISAAAFSSLPKLRLCDCNRKTVK